MSTYLVTGCAGFIGSTFVHYMLNKYMDIKIINLDALTYAGNLENLKDIEDDKRHIFVPGNICDKALVASASILSIRFLPLSSFFGRIFITLNCSKNQVGRYST